jgi:hypothetical protein
LSEKQPFSDNSRFEAERRKTHTYQFDNLAHFEFVFMSCFGSVISQVGVKVDGVFKLSELGGFLITVVLKYRLKKLLPINPTTWPTLSSFS